MSTVSPPAAPSSPSPSASRDAEPRWPVSVEIPVAWGDMDALRHVNNAVYARWLESARIAYLERVGLLGALEAEAIGPILARQVIDFQRPVQFPDVVKVDARVASLGTTSLVLRYRVHSRAHGAIVAQGESIVVLFDYAAGEKRALPEPLRAAIERLEGREAREPR